MKAKREELIGFVKWFNDYEELKYTEKGIKFYVDEYLKSINSNAPAESRNVSGSLRDKFASDALNGLMLRHNEPGYTDVDAVNEAYKIADMMMERREQ